MRIHYLGLAALLTVSACANSDKAAEPAAEVTPSADGRARIAAMTANAIAANPSAADSILKSAGYTQESFQKLMYEIASDSAMSIAYASAKTR